MLIENHKKSYKGLNIDINEKVTIGGVVMDRYKDNGNGTIDDRKEFGTLEYTVESE